MDSTISNAGQGKYISFPRPLVVALRNHKRLVQALRTSSNQWLHNSLTATTLCWTAVVSDISESLESD